MLRRTRRAGVAAIAVVVLALTGLVVPGAATAADPDFYSTPASLPAANGDLVRFEPSEFYLDPLKVVRSPASVTRIMYRSTDRHGTPIAVTGTVLEPRLPWSGSGPRPIVGYAVGTQGLGDQCAPSRQLAAGSEYEGLFIEGLLTRGYGVVVTDYQGLGTEGVHTYMSREVTGRAVLDSIRAAQRLPGSGLPTSGPVAITGYSQGGGAAAAAGELAASYSPELKVRGIAAGAIPGDLAAVARNLDGSLYFGFLGYAVAGLAESYTIDTAGMLNAQGEQVIDTLRGQCTVESIATFPFTRSRDLTHDGRAITAHLDEEPYRTAVAEQLIGDGRRPAAPTLVTHSLLDDVIPYGVGRGVAQRWCGQGATLRLATNTAPTHVGGAIASYPEVFAFLEARFAGLPMVSSCWRL
ncbi:lipase family protein [Nocardioides sp.]|uniref:lipase family protein n=1 Tax=Nocardioides sp. TaxID=35761 RepID=UPI002734D4A4|nr:lipase family protein [Nocardioides sp.]MDP3893856.1 lipase family protein [Nocardioides sp.]